MKRLKDSNIYLDNSTTAKPSGRAVSEMIPFLTERWGAFSSPHTMGQEHAKDVKRAYRSVYDFLGATDNDTVKITASGAEAVNQVIMGAYFAISAPTGRNQFLTASTDEAPAILAASRLQDLGCVTKMIPCTKEGLVTADTVANQVTPRTALISISWAHGLTGLVQPLSEISEICKERGIWFHVDATHALGKISADLEDLGIDLLTFNGSQWHAPPGTGGIWIREGIELPPLILGKELNTTSLIALGIAAQEAVESRDLLCLEAGRLRDRLETGITKEHPEAIPLFREQERLPHITAIAFPGIANEALLFALSRKGLYASIGGGSHQQIGLVLEASGMDPELAHTAISFSLSRETTDEEIDRAIEIIVETANKMRKYSEHIDGI